MGLISLICPSCGGNIELDDGRSIGFCLYCGQKILIEEAINNRVIIDQTPTINNLMQRATYYYEQNQGKKALEYINRVLDIDIDYLPAKELYTLVQNDLSLEAIVTGCFEIYERGAVLVCIIRKGEINEGEVIDLYCDNQFFGSYQVDQIAIKKNNSECICKNAKKGDTAHLLFKGLTKRTLRKVTRIYNPIGIIEKQKKDPKPWD